MALSCRGGAVHSIITGLMHRSNISRGLAPFSFACLYLRTKVLILSSRMGSSVPSRSCPPRTPRGAWPASSCWLGADAVAVAGQLGEALSGLVGRHRRVVDLTADRPLKHGRVDEGEFGMRVRRRVAARAVFDEHAFDALAGNVQQLVLVDEGHLGILRLRLMQDQA